MGYGIEWCVRCVCLHVVLVVKVVLVCGLVRMKKVACVGVACKKGRWGR